MQKSTLADTGNSNDIVKGYFAALDIGSNSFHYVLARKVGEQLQIMHRQALH